MMRPARFLDTAPGLAVLLALCLQSAAAHATEAQAENLKLEAGQEGTTLEPLTVEGENRARVDFQRPTLKLDLDALQVSGLSGGSARQLVLDTEPDLLTSYLSASAFAQPAVLARPWLADFAEGALVHFQPRLDQVEHWSLLIADSQGDTAVVFSGRGKPAEDLSWDGLRRDGHPALPGLVYSSVLTAWDRAENQRNFVGDGFTLPAYRIGDGERETLLMSGEDLGAPGDTRPLRLIGAIDRLNQAPAARPIRLTISARSYVQAQALEQRVLSAMAGRLLGDPLRLQTVMDVDPRAPEAGALRFSARAGSG